MVISHIPAFIKNNLLFYYKNRIDHNVKVRKILKSHIIQPFLKYYVIRKRIGIGKSVRVINVQFN